MKFYPIEGKQRRNVWLGIIAFVIAGVLLVQKIIITQPWLNEIFEISDGWIGYFQVASFLWPGLLLLVYFIFNQWIWKISWVSKFLEIPNLNGDWVGTVDRVEYGDNVDGTTSCKEEADVPVIAIIKQTYSRISVVVKNYNMETMSGYTSSETSVIGFEGDTGQSMKINLMFSIETKDGNFYGANALTYSKEKSAYSSVNEGDVDTLQGGYVTSLPRKGSVRLEKVHPKHSLHIGEVKLLKSNQGEEYFGISFSKELMKKAEKQLRKHIGKEKFERLLQKRIERDGDGYHLTVISPPEMSELNKKQLSELKSSKKEISYVVQRLGGLKRNDAETYFLTVHSQNGNLFRRRYGLGEKDFHITLGFTPEDIYDAPKDHTCWIGLSGFTLF